MLRRTSQTEMAGRAPPRLVAVALPPPCPSMCRDARMARAHGCAGAAPLRKGGDVSSNSGEIAVAVGECVPSLAEAGEGQGGGRSARHRPHLSAQLRNPFPIERQLLPRSKARREPHQRLDQHQLVDDHRRLCSKCQLAEEGDAHARGRQATGYGKRCSGRCPWPVAREPSKIQLHRQLPPRSGHHGDQLSVGVA